MPSTTSTTDPVPYYEVLSTFWAAACTRDFGVNGPHAGFAPGTLRDGERPLVLAVNAWCLDLFTRGKGRQRLEAEVDADLASPMPPVFGDLGLQIEIPPAASVLSKATAADLPRDRTAEPEPVPASEKDHDFPIHANRTRSLEWDPPQGLPAAPPRPLTMSVSRDRKLLADRLHGIRVQPKELAAAAGELDQIEARGPAFVVPASGLLDLATVVPDMVYRSRLSLEMSTGCRIFDSVSVAQHHVNIVVDRSCENKTDAKHAADIFMLDQPSAVPGIADATGRRSNICAHSTLENTSFLAFIHSGENAS